MEFDEKTKRFSGPGGLVLLDSFLLMRKRETQEELFRYCNFFVMPEDGRLLPNGTYGRNTVIGMLSRSLADFTVKVENQYVDPSVVDMSRVFGCDDLLLSHFVNGTKEKNPKFVDQIVDVFVPSKSLFVGFVGLVFASFLIGFALLLVIKKSRPISFNNYCMNFIFQSDKILRGRRSPLSYLLLFNLLFFFLTKHVVSNNIQTNRVVVDKDILLHDIQKIVETDMEFCLLLRNKDSDYFEQSNPGTLAHLLFYNKTRDLNHPCIMFTETGLNMKLSNFFLVGILLHQAIMSMIFSEF